MNRLGMLVDISHVADKTFWDVIETTKAPVIASHSSARAITQAPRNMTDDMLRAVAKNNGVVMVNFFPAFIDEQWRAAWNASKPEREKEQDALEAQYKAKGLPVPFEASDKIDREYAARIGRAPFKSLIDHFDHVDQGRRHRPRRHRHRLRWHPTTARRNRLRRGPAKGDSRSHGSGLHRRRYAQTSGGESSTCLPRRSGRSTEAARHRTGTGPIAPSRSSPPYLNDQLAFVARSVILLI